KNGMKMIVGTEDYLAPEQIVNSDAVDIRADIYSLGVTGYFLLTGRTLFNDTEQAYQKFLRHLARSPRPIREIRPEVPVELAAVLEKMMAKNPWDRYQTPADVVAALAPWTRTPLAPPPPLERPHLSPAARLSAVVEADRAATRKASSWVLSKVRPAE